MNVEGMPFMCLATIAGVASVKGGSFGGPWGFAPEEVGGRRIDRNSCCVTTFAFLGEQLADVDSTRRGESEREE